MQYINTVYDLAVNLQELTSEDSAFAVISTAWVGEIFLNPAWLTIPVSDAERLAYLKLVTGFVVALQPEMNCYPLGLATTVCFDVDGNPIP